MAFVRIRVRAYLTVGLVLSLSYGVHGIVPISAATSRQTSAIRSAEASQLLESAQVPAYATHAQATSHLLRRDLQGGNFGNVDSTGQRKTEGAVSEGPMMNSEPMTTEPSQVPESETSLLVREEAGHEGDPTIKTESTKFGNVVHSVYKPGTGYVMNWCNITNRAAFMSFLIRGMSYSELAVAPQARETFEAKCKDLVLFAVGGTKMVAASEVKVSLHGGPMAIVVEATITPTMHCADEVLNSLVALDKPITALLKETALSTAEMHVAIMSTLDDIKVEAQTKPMLISLAFASNVSVKQEYRKEIMLGHGELGGVFCGSHWARDCAKCPPMGIGDSWCNGDCFWDENAKDSPRGKCVFRWDMLWCGGHAAKNCGECVWSGTQFRGKNWCNGECYWLNNECYAKHPNAPQMPLLGFKSSREKEAAMRTVPTTITATTTSVLNTLPPIYAQKPTTEPPVIGVMEPGKKNCNCCQAVSPPCIACQQKCDANATSGKTAPTQPGQPMDEQSAWAARAKDIVKEPFNIESTNSIKRKAWEDRTNLIISEPMSSEQAALERSAWVARVNDIIKEPIVSDLSLEEADESFDPTASMDSAANIGVNLLVVGKVTSHSANILLELRGYKRVIQDLCTKQAGQVLWLHANGKDYAPNKGSPCERLAQMLPVVFSFEKLPQGTRLGVVFATGLSFLRQAEVRTNNMVSESQQVAVVSCNKVSNTIEEVPESTDVWTPLQEKVRSGQVDVLLHLGDQVYIDSDRHKYMGGSIDGRTKESIEMWCPYCRAEELLKSESRSTWDSYAEQIRDSFRDMYRATWSYPPTAYVLANTANYFMTDDHDLRDGIGNEADKNSIHAFLATLAFEVAWEYQFALMGPWEKPLEQAYFYTTITNNIGMFMVDPRIARSILSESNSNAHSPWDQQYLKRGQWDALHRALGPEGSASNVSVLLMGTPLPLVYKVGWMHKLIAGYSDDYLGSWAAKATEQSSLLQLLDKWQATAEGRRTAVVVSGDVNRGGHSGIYPKWGGYPKFMQLTASAISNHDSIQEAHSSLWDYVLDLGEQMRHYSFQHRGWSNKNNFGMLDIRTPLGEKAAVVQSLYISDGNFGAINYSEFSIDSFGIAVPNEAFVYILLAALLLRCIIGFVMRRCFRSDTAATLAAKRAPPQATWKTRRSTN